MSAFASPLRPRGTTTRAGRRRPVCALAFLLAVALFPQAAAHAEGFGDLPVAVEVRIVKYAEQELARVERVLRQQHGVEPDKVANLTVPLQNYLEDALGGGTVTVYPRAVFAVALKALRANAKKEELGRRLVEYQREGRFAKVAKGEAE